MPLFSVRRPRALLQGVARLALAGALVGAPLPFAMAGQSTATMPITASVAPVCVVTSGSLNFGPYDPIVVNATTPRDATGLLSLQCVRNTTYWVAISQGQNGTATERKMKDVAGPTLLTYELYTDAARTTVWNANNPTNTVGGTATGNGAITLTVYGRIPPGQDVVASSYADTVNVTVNF